jgi:hypothetical protein
MPDVRSVQAVSLAMRMAASRVSPPPLRHTVRPPKVIQTSQLNLARRGVSRNMAAKNTTMKATPSSTGSLRFPVFTASSGSRGSQREVEDARIRRAVGFFRKYSGGERSLGALRRSQYLCFVFPAATVGSFLRMPGGDAGRSHFHPRGCQPLPAGAHAGFVWQRRIWVRLVTAELGSFAASRACARKEVAHFAKFLVALLNGFVRRKL